MTEQTQKTSSEAKKEAARIAGSGRKVRDRIRDLVVDLFEKGKFDVKQVQSISTQMLHGASDGIKSTLDTDGAGVMKQVVEGVADGISTASNRASATIREAAGKGKTLAKKEWDQVTSTLGKIEKEFVQTVSNVAGDVSKQVKMQSSEMVDHAKRAAADIRPSLESSLKALTEHPIEFATDGVKAGVAATRQAAGLAAEVAGGMMRGAGDLMSDLADKVTGGSSRSGTAAPKAGRTTKATAKPKKKAAKKAASKKPG